MQRRARRLPWSHSHKPSSRRRSSSVTVVSRALHQRILRQPRRRNDISNYRKHNYSRKAACGRRWWRCLQSAAPLASALLFFSDEVCACQAQSFASQTKNGENYFFSLSWTTRLPNLEGVRRLQRVQGRGQKIVTFENWCPRLGSRTSSLPILDPPTQNGRSVYMRQPVCKNWRARVDCSAR